MQNAHDFSTTDSIERVLQKRKTGLIIHSISVVGIDVRLKRSV